jgi:hypothetical protein
VSGVREGSAMIITQIYTDQIRLAQLSLKNKWFAGNGGHLNGQCDFCTDAVEQKHQAITRNRELKEFRGCEWCCIDPLICGKQGYVQELIDLYPHRGDTFIFQMFPGQLTRMRDLFIALMVKARYMIKLIGETNATSFFYLPRSPLFRLG